MTDFDGEETSRNAMLNAAVALARVGIETRLYEAAHALRLYLKEPTIAAGTYVAETPGRKVAVFNDTGISREDKLRVRDALQAYRDLLAAEGRWNGWLRAPDGL